MSVRYNLLVGDGTQWWVCDQTAAANGRVRLQAGTALHGQVLWRKAVCANCVVGGFSESCPIKTIRSALCMHHLFLLPFLPRHRPTRRSRIIRAGARQSVCVCECTFHKSPILSGQQERQWRVGGQTVPVPYCVLCSFHPRLRTTCTYKEESAPRSPSYQSWQLVLVVTSLCTMTTCNTITQLHSTELLGQSMTRRARDMHPALPHFGIL